MSRLCGCGCGESIDHRARQARYLNPTHAQRVYDKGVRARKISWRAPHQKPLISEVEAKAIEDRLRFEHELNEMIESDDTLVGKSTKGRVGTSMRGQGGILFWAMPLYARQRQP